MFNKVKHAPAPLFFKIGLALAAAAVAAFLYIDNVLEPENRNKSYELYLLFSVLVSGFTSPAYIFAGLVYFLMFHFRRPTHATLNLLHFCLTFGSLAVAFSLFHFRIFKAIELSKDQYYGIFSQRMSQYLFEEVAMVWYSLIGIWLFGQVVFLLNVVYSLAVRQPTPPENFTENRFARTDILDS